MLVYSVVLFLSYRKEQPVYVDRTFTDKARAIKHAQSFRPSDEDNYGGYGSDSERSKVVYENGVFYQDDGKFVVVVFECEVDDGAD